MKILFNDVIQNSNDADNLKTPALSETTTISGTTTITLDRAYPINCVGIGNYNSPQIFVNGQIVQFVGNGLYLLATPLNTSVLNISVPISATIGRIAAGLYCNIPTSIAKQPGFNSTASPRVTLSGQVITGKGGYNFRTLGLDSRYKITEEIMKEIEAGYPYISQGYPFFIDLSDEAYKLPFDKLYATDTNQQNLRFDSGVRKFLYSRRWNFEERF